MVLCNHTLLGEESHDSEPGGEKRGEKRENDAKTQDNGVCGTCAVWLRTDVRKPLLCLARSVEIAWSRHLKACGKEGGMKMTVDLPNGLLASAMEAGKCKTEADAVVRALQMLARSSCTARLRLLRGSMPDFSLDLDVLRSRT